MKRLIVFAALLIVIASFLGAVSAEEEIIILSDENESVLTEPEDDSNLIVLSPGDRYNRSVTLTGVTKNMDAASIYCENKGYSSETRSDTTGKEYKVCVFPDGKECQGLEFLRGKCGKEYASITEEELTEAIVSGTNLKLKEKKCGAGCQLKIGESRVTISESGEKKSVAAENTSAETELDLTVEEVDGKVMLRAYLSNGRWALVKYLPDKASDKASEVLGEKCAERGCTLELKEIRVDKKEKLAYEVKTSKEVKILGFIKNRAVMTAQVDAESGQVIKVGKPWWAFLAR